MRGSRLSCGVLVLAALLTWSLVSSWGCGYRREQGSQASGNPQGTLDTGTTSKAAEVDHQPVNQGSGRASWSGQSAPGGQMAVTSTQSAERIHAAQAVRAQTSPENLEGGIQLARQAPIGPSNGGTGDPTRPEILEPAPATGPPPNAETAAYPAAASGSKAPSPEASAPSGRAAAPASQGTSQLDQGPRAADTPVDAALASRGKALFAQKTCNACHRMDVKLVGPPLGPVPRQRSAAWILAMIQNPAGMTQTDPVAKQLLQEYKAQMVVPGGVTPQEAKALLEYIKSGGK